MPNPLTSEERAQILEVLEMLAAHCDEKDQDADPDDIPCIRCGKDALDTGWECTECGFDCRPYYYPQALLRKAAAELSRAADDARDAENAGIRKAADWVRDRRFAFESENGYIEPDTGAMSFGTGPHANAKDEYDYELVEIEEGLRALASSKSEAAEGGEDG